MGFAAKPMIWPNLRTGAPSAIGALAILWPRGTRSSRHHALNEGARRNLIDRHHDIVVGVKADGAGLSDLFVHSGSLAAAIRDHSTNETCCHCVSAKARREPYASRSTAPWPVKLKARPSACPHAAASMSLRFD